MAKPKKHIAVQEDFSFMKELGQESNTNESLNENKDNKTTEVTDTIMSSTGNLVNIPCIKNNTPPQILCRNQYGLYNHIDYSFNSEGFVNWRSMIPTRFLYVGDNIKENPLRRELFEKKYGKKPEKVDLLVDKIEDRDLLITLAGIRYLASLRGYEIVEFKTLESSNQNYAVVNCAIYWRTNYENTFNEKDLYFNTVRFDAVGCASIDNTNGKFRNYLPEIASNRAFCRAVRNFLNIDVVSDEEVFSEKEEVKPTTSSGVTPYGKPEEVLKAKMDEKGITFQKLKDAMIKKDKEWEKFESILDIPPIKIFDVLGRLRDKEKKDKDGPVPE